MSKTEYIPFLIGGNSHCPGCSRPYGEEYEFSPFAEAHKCVVCGIPFDAREAGQPGYTPLGYGISRRSGPR